MSKLQHVNLKITDDMHKTLNAIAQSEDKSMSEVIRNLVQRGLERDYIDNSADLIADIVHRELEVVLKTHTNRLAALTSKVGHASVASMFLNLQAFLDLVPPDKRRDVKEIHEKAMKKAVVYMKTPLADLAKEDLE